ncbi:MAG: phosphatase PAP2 family protein [Desulfuromonadaceae bacterium]
MYCSFNKYKATFFCGIALLTTLMAGAWAIHHEPVEKLDRMILEWFNTRRTEGLDQLFLNVSWAGSNFILLPVILVQACILITRKKVRDAMFLVVSFVGASALSNIFKFVIARPRPDLFPLLISLPTGFSFPSSHASQITGFVLAELVLLKVLMGSKSFVLFNIAGGVLILLVCLSRLYLQVHYPTDVVAGFLTSLFWVAALAALILSDRHNTQLICPVVTSRKVNNHEKQISRHR